MIERLKYYSLTLLEAMMELNKDKHKILYITRTINPQTFEALI